MTAAAIDIPSALRQVGLKPDDWVMLHGDAGVAAQLRGIDPPRRLPHLIGQLVEFWRPGTLIVPTFSYSFTKGEDFDAAHTPSAVGQFSEAFRTFPGVQRTRHPIFSVAATGPGAGLVLGARLDDCFGPGTVFDLLFRNEGKIVCLGCDFGKITFVHYVEQMHGVSYRHPKIFRGAVIDDGKRTVLETTYLVRDMAIRSRHDLGRLQAEAIRQGALAVGAIGRFPLLSISTRRFLELGCHLLEQDEHALISQGAGGDGV
jgi:aminoglycoside 3-N-acetyltransferase